MTTTMASLLLRKQNKYVFVKDPYLRNNNPREFKSMMCCLFPPKLSWLIKTQMYIQMNTEYFDWLNGITWQYYSIDGSSSHDIPSLSEYYHIVWHDVLLSLCKQTSDLSIGYDLISTCASACSWLSRRKCTCWWIIVCSNMAA